MSLSRWFLLIGFFSLLIGFVVKFDMSPENIYQQQYMMLVSIKWALNAVFWILLGTALGAEERNGFRIGER